MEELESKLYRYSQSENYPFHMPGHKRQADKIFDAQPAFEKLSEAYKMDITEIDGFDNLHHPEGVILDLMNEMKQFYHTEMTCLLVNGSTAGILAAVCACTNSNDSVLIARNCHKSVLNACFLKNLNVSYIIPSVLKECCTYGAVTVNQVTEMMDKNPSVKVVVIVSPTYEGIVSDVRAIADAVHERGAVLIVDEAHGAHLPFGCDRALFPESALFCGADLVIQSVHKTLPSMTQTALLHVNSGRVSRKKIERYLSIYQTSSPSYVLMSSISLCFHFMKNEGEKKMREYADRLRRLRIELKGLNFAGLLDADMAKKGGAYGYDCSKIVLYMRNGDGSGVRLMNRLRDEFCLELEMCSPAHVIAMTSLMDTDDGFEKLRCALKKIDEEPVSLPEPEGALLAVRALKNIPVQVMSSAKAHEMDSEIKSIGAAAGCISAQTLFVYPPGQAFLVAGEKITEDVTRQIIWYQKNGFEVNGMCGTGNLYVICGRESDKV